MAVGVAVSGSAFGQFWTRSTMTNDAVESYDQQLAKLTLAAWLGTTSNWPSLHGAIAHKPAKMLPASTRDLLEGSLRSIIVIMPSVLNFMIRARPCFEMACSRLVASGGQGSMAQLRARDRQLTWGLSPYFLILQERHTSTMPTKKSRHEI